MQKAIWFGRGALKKKWPPYGDQLGKKITGPLSLWLGWQLGLGVPGREELSFSLYTGEG